MSPPEIELVLVQTPDQVAVLERKIRHSRECGVDSEFSGPKLVGEDYVNIYRSSLTGLSFAFWDRSAYYLPIAHKRGNCPPLEVKRILSALHEREHITWLHNAKVEIEILHQQGVRVRKPACSMILLWLLGLPGKGKKKDSISYGLKQLVAQHYGRARKTFEDVSKGKQFADLDPEDALEYAALDAWDTLELGQVFYPQAEEMRLTDVFWEQEMPTVDVVVEMERAGMGVDCSRLEALYEELNADLEKLKQQWDELCPGVLISGAEQVSKHFFQKANGLGEKNYWPTKDVPRGKGRLVKIKDDFGDVVGEERVSYLCVNKDVMEAAAAHPQTPEWAKKAAEIRIEWSALEKNRSTYTLKLVDSARQHEDGRLHSSFHQTGTRTGRFSSSGPNLQNIPVRSELGQRVKQAFTPAPGYVLLAADYSQIELRVLAHLTKRGYLFDAYTKGLDVHQMTADAASKATGVEVIRDDGKTLNFSIIYGSGLKKTAKQMKCDMKTAKKLRGFMKELLHEEYAWLDKVRSHAERRGFVRTAVGRIRRIPEFTAHEGKECQRTQENWQCEWCYLESKARRIAGNTPIQGLAGDIFKRAMIGIRGCFSTETARIIGQVHDEITLEVREDSVKDVAAVVKAEMENAYELRVPLIAEPKWGPTWADCK